MPGADTRPSHGTCPICEARAAARWRPFCSNRCADVDLGRWLTGQYAIPSEDHAGDPSGDQTGDHIGDFLGDLSEDR